MPMVIYRQGMLDPTTNRAKDVDKEVFLALRVFDETLSWYMNDNLPPGFDPVTMGPLLAVFWPKHTINGFMFDSMPPIVVEQYSKGCPFPSCLGPE